MSRQKRISQHLFSALEIQDDVEAKDRGVAAARQNAWHFECAWEVANKVGGIYTVIRSKAGVTVDELGDQYCLLGPFDDSSVKTEVEVMEPSASGQTRFLRQTIDALRTRGITITYGRWLIEGYPQVLLFDIPSGHWAEAEAKSELWEKARIAVPPEDRETANSVVFGFLVAWFLCEFRHQLDRENSSSAPTYSYAPSPPPPPLVQAHFHEWQSAVGLILSRVRKHKVSTIFTTHATLLGRYLCAGSVDFYNSLSSFNPDAEANQRGIFHRYCIERAAANLAHVFATVSRVTALEATHLLGREPDVVTPNGLGVKKFAAIHEFQNLHAIAKEKIHNFVRGHFYGHFDFELDKTLYFFIAGRYEFSNKGADLFIESLARLNHRLKEIDSDVTVVAFIIMPTKTNNFNVESLRGQAISKQLRETVNEVQKDIGNRLYEICLRGKVPSGGDIVFKEDVVKLKRCTFSVNRQTLPPVCTHNVVNDAEDQVLLAIRRCKLFNHRQDRVKIVFHPEFLNSTNPLFAIDYEEFARGCHLGVFPSYYEPWGYTPAECTVMGIPSVTTNLSGFGCFMSEHIADPLSYGIYIVDRRTKSLEESVEQLQSFMFDFSQLTRRQRVVQRNRTERLSELLDWKNLGSYYSRARRLGMEKAFPEAFSRLLEGKRPQEREEVMVPRPYSAPGSRAPSPTRDGDVEEEEEEAEQ